MIIKEPFLKEKPALPDSESTHCILSTPPFHLVFHSDFGVFHPDFGVSHPDFGVSHPDFGVSHPDFGVFHSNFGG
jgi:hypothetical protein